MGGVVPGCYGLEDYRPHRPILSPGLGVGGGPGQLHNTVGNMGGVPGINDRGGGPGSSSGGSNSGSFLGSLFGSKRAKPPPPLTPLTPPGPHYPAPVPPPTTGGPPPLSPSALSQSDPSGPSKIQALHAQYCHNNFGQPPPPYHHHHRYHMQAVTPGHPPAIHHTLHRGSLPRRGPPVPSHAQLQQQLSHHAMQHGRYGNMACTPPPLSPHSPNFPIAPFTFYHMHPNPIRHVRVPGPTGKLPLTLSHSQPHPHAHSHGHSHTHSHLVHAHSPHPLLDHSAHQTHFVFSPPPQAPSTITARHIPQGAAHYIPQYPPLSSIPPPPPHSPLPPPMSPHTPLTPLTPLSPLAPQLPGPMGAQSGGPGGGGGGASNSGTVGSSKSKPINRISTVVWGWAAALGTGSQRGGARVQARGSKPNSHSVTSISASLTCRAGILAG